MGSHVKEACWLPLGSRTWRTRGHALQVTANFPRKDGKMGKNLRTFLQQIGEQCPDELKIVKRKVNPVYEITAICEKLERERKQFPGVFFTNVEGSDLPVLINSMASYERMSMSLDLTRDQMIQGYADREDNPIPPREVPKNQAPVKQVILKGDDIDLYKFPFTHHNEDDAGRYISAGVSIVKDRQSGRQNMGIYRLQIQGKDQLGFMVNPGNHANYIRQDYEDAGERTEIAIVIGHHPAFYMASVSRVWCEEMEVAGGLLQEPLEVVKAETVDLMVPAEAEIIIEGYIPPNERHYEGTFGEWPGYYNKEGDQPIIKVTAITMRHDAICQDLFNAHMEHSVLGAVPRLGSLYRNIKRVCPSLQAVNLPYSGRCRAFCYISLKKRAEGEPKQAAFVAFATDNNIRRVIVVDDDIDVFNEEDVQWAVAMRFQADRDLALIPNSLGGHLNPGAYGYDRLSQGPMETKEILDATKPLPPVRFPKRAHVPKDLLDQINLDDYLLDLDRQELRSRVS